MLILTAQEETTSVVASNEMKKPKVKFTYEETTAEQRAVRPL
jgi:hypothetical protein